jgi:hypothetical protein
MRPYQLYSPVYLTGPNAGQVAPLGSRQPFPNNKVPINSKVAAAMVASPLFAQQEEQQSYYTSGYVHAYQGDVKIDWEPTKAITSWAAIRRCTPSTRAATAPTC